MERRSTVKRIVADPQRCMACRACELACAVAHAETSDLVLAIRQGAAKPRIYIESAGGLAVPLQCRHCEDAPCMRVCPTAALWREGETAPVVVEQAKCIGCAYCVEVCPFGVIRLAQSATGGLPGNGKAVVKCDLCMRRQAEGLAPACVSACPVRALSFEDVDEGARRARRKTALAAIAGPEDVRQY